MDATWTRQETLYGPRTAGRLKGHRPAADMAATMVAPTHASQCVQAGSAAAVEWVIEAPDAVTAFTIVYGRWLKTDDQTPAGDAINAWMEVGTIAITGATNGELFRFEQSTYSDRVGMYVNNFTGVASEPFRFWFREVG